MEKLCNYEFLGCLTQGENYRIMKATHKPTGIIVIVKIYPKNLDEVHQLREKIENEVNITRNLHHPFINRLFDYFQDEQNFYLVHEFLENGELTNFIINNEKLTEETSLLYFSQLVSSVKYLRDQGLVHCDICSKNVHIDHYFHIRLTGFSLSQHLNDKSTLHDSYSHIGYLSPEVLNGEPFSTMSDIWSLGVLLYLMCSGTLPFRGNNAGLLVFSIINTEPEYPEYFSYELCDLLTQIFKKSPIERITLEKIVQHPWFTQVHYPFINGNSFEIDQEIIQKFPKYSLDPNKISFLHGNEFINNETVSYYLLSREKEVIQISENYRQTLITTYSDTTSNNSNLDSNNGHSNSSSITHMILSKRQQKSQPLAASFMQHKMRHEHSIVARADKRRGNGRRPIKKISKAVI